METRNEKLGTRRSTDRYFGGFMEKPTMADIEYTLVQINLKPRTYAKLEEIKERLHAENRAEAVKKSLYITDLISRIIKKGGRVILEESDGTRSKLVLPEL